MTGSGNRPLDNKKYTYMKNPMHEDAGMGPHRRFQPIVSFLPAWGGSGKSPQNEKEIVKMEGYAGHPIRSFRSCFSDRAICPKSIFFARAFTQWAIRVARVGAVLAPLT